ncbi:MAG: hypothetical protein WC997_05640 [Porticoccaceae bacterium]
MFDKIIFFAFLIALPVPSYADSPPLNIYLADSPYPMPHVDSSASGFSRFPGPDLGDSYQLTDHNVIFKPVGFGNGYSFLYSDKYSDGRRAIYGGGSDRVFKLDADTLETISSYSLREGYFSSDREVSNFFNTADILIQAGIKDSSKQMHFFDHVYRTHIPALRLGSGAVYKFLTKNNELFIAVKDSSSGSIYIKVFGDKEFDDFESPLVLKRSVALPIDKSNNPLPMAMSLTYDGNIVVVTNDGQIFVLNQDLEKYDSLVLPEAKALSPDAEWMGGVVRNTISLDDKGGIYIVSSDFLHRVQWTGKNLTLDPRYGAWSVPYEAGENGSGTTPTPIGWGEGNDLLVVMADGVNGVNVYWRDEIPDDWQGIPNHPRRLAGTIPLTFGYDTSDRLRIEASPVAYGYGFFWPNDAPKVEPQWQGSYDRQMFANYTALHFPQYPVHGGVKYHWNSIKRELEVAWTTHLSLAPTICTPNIKKFLYCIGRRDGQYSVEVLDWGSGESVRYYLLGESLRFNATASNTRVTDKYIEFSSLGSAIVRVNLEKIDK